MNERRRMNIRIKGRRRSNEKNQEKAIEDENYYEKNLGEKIHVSNLLLTKLKKLSIEELIMLFKGSSCYFYW